jgi:hypothetical protein
MRFSKTIMMAAGASLLAGCAMQPLGPTVRVMPAPYKPFEVFEREQADCEDYASSQVAGEAQQANNRALGAAALGAGLGLALGAATGDGHAASFGAAAGGTAGTVIGADQSDRANFGIQRRYDIAYAQCMYSKGNQVPGFADARRGPPPPPPPGEGRYRRPPRDRDYDRDDYPPDDRDRY